MTGHRLPTAAEWARCRAGAEWLDLVGPAGWADLVDLDTLDMGSECSDVLGQITVAALGFQVVDDLIVSDSSDRRTWPDLDGAPTGFGLWREGEGPVPPVALVDCPRLGLMGQRSTRTADQAAEYEALTVAWADLIRTRQTGPQL